MTGTWWHGAPPVRSAELPAHQPDTDTAGGSAPRRADTAARLAAAGAELEAGALGSRAQPPPVWHHHRVPPPCRLPSRPEPPTGVRPQVAGERVPPAARVVAEGTLEGLLAGVQLDVTQEVSLLGEGGSALVAVEWPFSCKTGAAGETPR